MPKSKISKITEETVLGVVLKKKDANEILSKHGVPCVSCPMAQMELNSLTLGNICSRYGLDLKNLLKDLNK
jgi:hypothetical protein